MSMIAFGHRDTMTYPVNGQIQLLVRLLAYAFRMRPASILTILLGTFSSLLEVAGLAVLIPLSRLAAQQPIAQSSPWFWFSQVFGQRADAQFYMIAFFLLLFARTLTQLISNVLAHHINRSMNATFSVRALEAFVRHLSFAQMQKESIGHFVAVAGDEAVRAAQIVSSVIRLIPLLVLFLLYSAMITYQSWRVGAAFAFFIIFVLCCLWSAFKKSRRLGVLHQSQSREAGTHFIESLSGLRTVRSFTAENYVTSRYNEMMQGYMQTLFRIDAINALGGVLPTLLLAGGMLAACAELFTGTQLNVLLPSVMVGILMVMRLLPLATQTLDTALRLTADLKAAQNVSEMLEAVKAADIAEWEEPRLLKEPIRQIEFDNVSFRYEAGLAPVLDKFSTILTAGRSYAISGPSGAGKSTVVDLLLKFYQPQSGAIRVNGIDIKNISHTSLRMHIVLAEQTVRIFFDTIERNVQFGYEATPKDISDVLDAVGLFDLTSSLPKGVDTLLNFQGSNISGGQRQRIGLARALLRSADVLIMDESTSALDQATREKLLANLLPRYKDKIILFVAHDPAILKQVDEVIELKQCALPVDERLSALTVS